MYSSEELVKTQNENKNQLLKTVSHLEEVGDISVKNTNEIGELEKRSVLINEMVELIKEVANKTNILSINASIEASRSGEAGSGFAVVAAEIRELSKETIDKVYEAIEVARTTGKIKKGTNEVTKAIEKGTAKIVAYAKDVNPPEITMHIPLLCEEKGIKCAEVPSKEELGAASGIEKPTASVAIVQEGEAKNLIKEIAGSKKKE